MEHLWLYVHDGWDLVDLREVRDADDAERRVSDLNFRRPAPVRFLAGCRRRGWWLVRAATQGEAIRLGGMLAAGTHPDRYEIEHDHALLRAGLRGDSLKGQIFIQRGTTP